MSILITGAAGQVGSEVVRRGGVGVVGLDRASLDVGNEQAVKAAIKQYSPRVVINMAAYTAVDRAESEPEKAFAINAVAPGVLGRVCAEAGIPVFHLSTDYVFDGEGSDAYCETDSVAPLGVYARSKCEGEVALRETGAKHIILRVSWVVGANGNNFVKTMLRLGADREEVRVVADQNGAPTCAVDIADVLLDLASRYIAGQELSWGTYHYCGSPITTWHGFAERIFSRACAKGLLLKAPLLIAISTNDYPTLARRPLNSRLNCSKFEATFGISIKNWEIGLEHILDELL